MTSTVRAAAALLTLAPALALALPSTGSAQSVAVNVRAGTLGLVPGVTIGVHDHVNVRVEVPWLNSSVEAEQEVEEFPVLYTAGADILSPGAIIDLHPFAGRLRLSAGAYLGRRTFVLDARAAESVTVDGRTFTPEEIGVLEGVIRFGEGVVPYVGLGFGNAVAANKRIGFTTDLGVVFTGSPSVSLVGTGEIQPSGDEARQLEEELGFLSMWPVLSFGLSVRVF